MVAEQVSWWEQAQLDLRQKIERGDTQMQENYRAPEAGTKLAFELQPGDPVLVREFIPGKNKLKARGPYTLLQKIRGSGAEVISAKGKTKRVAISNLKPYRPPITGEVRVTTRA